MDDIIVIVLLILLNGVFSMSEIALISARKSRLSSDARKGSRGAAAALRLAEDPDRFLSTIQIGITLIGILTGLYSGAALADDVGALLERMGIGPKAARPIGQVSIVVVVTYLSIVVGELVPKRIGLAAANTVAKLISRPMRLMATVALPAVWLLSVSTSFLVRIFGLKNRGNNVTEDEIKSRIQDGADAGEVKKVEQDIMERALVLGDLRVASIMTPKVDVKSLNLDMDVAEIKHTLSDNLHNSYPVYCNLRQDAVCGMVSLKQLILTIDRPGFRLQDVVSAPVYFPETMSVYDALDTLKSKRVHFALVCDEFGDISGVVTPGDVLDGLVGELPQVGASEMISPSGVPGRWLVDAGISFYDFLTHFECEDLYHPAPYSTLGGFMLEELKHIPVAGEQYEWNGVMFEIAEMTGAKIGKILVSFNTQDERS